VPVGFKGLQLRFVLDTNASDEQLETLIRRRKKSLKLDKNTPNQRLLSSVAETA